MNVSCGESSSLLRLDQSVHLSQHAFRRDVIIVSTSGGFVDAVYLYLKWLFMMTDNCRGRNLTKWWLPSINSNTEQKILQPIAIFFGWTIPTCITSIYLSLVPFLELHIQIHHDSTCFLITLRECWTFFNPAVNHNVCSRAPRLENTARQQLFSGLLSPGLNRDKTTF